MLVRLTQADPLPERFQRGLQNMSAKLHRDSRTAAKDRYLAPMTASTEAERGPITTAEADKAYRTIRAYMLLSAAWFLLICLALMLFDFAGWQLYLGLVAAIEGIGIPIFLRSYRRELDERASASAIAAFIDDDRR